MEGETKWVSVCLFRVRFTQEVEDESTSCCPLHPNPVIMKLNPWWETHRVDFVYRHVNIGSSRDMRCFGERETERQSCKQPVSVRRRKIGLLINNKSLVHLPYISCLHLCHFGNRLLFTFQPLLLVHSHICQCGILSNTALYWSGI